MAANPYEALPELFRGVWKRYVDGEEGIPELRIAPRVQQDATTGQYQVLNTRLWYDAQKQNAGYAAYDGTKERFQSLEYDTLTTALRPFEAVPVRVTDAIRRMLESPNPDLRVLDTARELVERSLRGRLAAEIITEIASLSAGDTATLDLTTASTDVGKILSQQADEIEEDTGFRPDLFIFGPKAATLMKTVNTKIMTFVGQASTGGATSGVVSDAALESYFREVVGCGILIPRRVAGTAAGAAAFQWGTTGAFVVTGEGEMPSCLKTCSPSAELFDVYVDELRAFEGGPGQVISARGFLDVVTQDSNLGRKYTLTLA